MKNKISAFTLVELLVVVSVILILSTLTILNLSSTRARARDQQRISSAELIGSAIDQYAMSNARKLPSPEVVSPGSATQYLIANINPKEGSCVFCTIIQPYINPVPKDSLSTDTASNMKYVYNTDRTKAAVIIDDMENGRALCNIDTTDTTSLPDPVKAYMGIELPPTSETNPNPCYFVSR